MGMAGAWGPQGHWEHGDAGNMGTTGTLGACGCWEHGDHRDTGSKNMLGARGAHGHWEHGDGRSMGTTGTLGTYGHWEHVDAGNTEGMRTPGARGTLSPQAASRQRPPPFSPPSLAYFPRVISLSLLESEGAPSSLRTHTPHPPGRSEDGRDPTVTRAAPAQRRRRRRGPRRPVLGHRVPRLLQRGGTSHSAQRQRGKGPSGKPRHTETQTQTKGLTKPHRAGPCKRCSNSLVCSACCLNRT